MAEPSRISRDVDRKIYDMARSYFADGKRRNADKLPEFRTMISGEMDDGTSRSLMVKILPNPINPRLATGWRVVAEDKVWEIPSDEMEKSRLLDGAGGLSGASG
jgi:hypothetical protein